MKKLTIFLFVLVVACNSGKKSFIITQIGYEIPIELVLSEDTVKFVNEVYIVDSVTFKPYETYHCGEHKFTLKEMF